MAIDTRKYIPPHLRESYGDASPEAQAWIDLEAEAEAQRLLERIKNRDPEFARKVAAKLYGAVTPVKTPSSDGE